MFLKSNGENDLLTREEIEALYTESGFDFEKAFDRLLVFVQEIEQEQVNHYCYEEHADSSIIGVASALQIGGQNVQEQDEESEEWEQWPEDFNDMGNDGGVGAH